MVKLFERSTPPEIWQIMNNWYSCSTASVLWNNSQSSQFALCQGVRQGAILSPLLYSIFVDNLLISLSSSGFGVKIDDIFCGALMYADDLALIAGSESDLQHMLDIASSYAKSWKYSFNATKSSVLVLGEASRSRALRRPTRHWLIQGSPIPEKDEQKHLGVLQTVFHSTVHRTTRRCSAGRSTFYALNAVGSRHGCLHPLTSYHLYITLCVPILLYGSELWCLTKSETTMLESVHRTIQGVPSRCHSSALLHLLDSLSITNMIHLKQLNFAYSFSSMVQDALPRKVLLNRMVSNPMKGSIPIWNQLLEENDLPLLHELYTLEEPWSRDTWKKIIKSQFLATSLWSFQTQCQHLPLSWCTPKLQ